MNTSADTNTTGKTGGLDKSEVGQEVISEPNGNFLSKTGIHSLPITGPFPGAVTEGVQNIDHQDTGNIDLPTITEQLLSETDVRKIRAQILRECENIFENGLATGNGEELDTLSHLLAHLQNGIEVLLYESNNTHLIQGYFERVKIIMQTCVEYLLFMKGIEHYKLKAFLANNSLFFESVYKGSPENGVVLKTLNTFLPDIVSLAKDKYNLKPMTESLLSIINYIVKKNVDGLAFLLNDNYFQEAITEFVDRYLECDLEVFIKILEKSYNKILLSKHSFIDEKSAESPGFKMIRILNSPEFIGHDIDFFINSLTRSIRLEAIPYTTRLLFDNSEKLIGDLKMQIEDLHSSSRTSIEITERNLETMIDYREELPVLPTNHIVRFRVRFNLLVSQITHSSSGNLDTPPLLLAKLLQGEQGFDVKDPEMIVKLYLSILESSIFYLDDIIYTSTGKTVSDKSLYTLIAFQLQEFDIIFEKFANLPLKRSLNSIYYYILKALGKTDDEVLEYISSYFDEFDPKKIHHYSMDISRIIDEYIETIREKLIGKLAILDSANEKLDADLIYEQYILEMFINGVRKDDIYYADNIDQIAFDFFRSNPEEKKVDNLVRHVIISIAQNASLRFMRLVKDKGVENVNYTKMAIIAERMLHRNPEFLASARRFLQISSSQSLGYFLGKYFSNVNSVPVKEAVES